MRDNFRVLINQIDPSQNAKITIASIMKLLGYKENDIMKIIANTPRGVISIPNSNKNKYKKWEKIFSKIWIKFFFLLN